MATRLVNLKVKEVSLVKRGANPKAQILVFKSEESRMSKFAGFMTGLKGALSILATGKTPDGEIIKSEEEQIGEIEKQLDVVANSLSASVEKNAAVHDPNNPNCDCPDCVAAEDAADGGADDSTETDSAKGKKMQKENVEAIAKAESRAAAAEDIAKAAETRAKAAEDRIAAIEKRETHAQAVIKAKNLLGNLSGDPEKFAEVVKSLSDDQMAVLEPVLKAGSDATRVALMTTIGSGKAGPGSTGERIQKAAEEIQKSQPKLTKQQAIRKALDNDPSLYEQSNSAN